MTRPQEIDIQSLRILSDTDAVREIDQYISTKNHRVSIAEIAEHTVLPFDQIGDNAAIAAQMCGRVFRESVRKGYACILDLM